MRAETYAGGGNVDYWPRPPPLRIQHSNAAKWRKAVKNGRLRFQSPDTGGAANLGTPLGLLHISSITWLWKDTGSSVGPMWSSLATVNISGHYSWDRPYTSKSISFIQQTQHCLCDNVIFKGSSGLIERVACWNIKNRTCVWIFDCLVWLLEACSLAERKGFIICMWMNFGADLQSWDKAKKGDMCDTVTLKALMLQRDVCVISYSYASLLKVSREILSSLKPSGHSLTCLIPSVLRAKEKIRSF